MVVVVLGYAPCGDGASTGVSRMQHVADGKWHMADWSRQLCCCQGAVRIVVSMFAVWRPGLGQNIGTFWTTKSANFFSRVYPMHFASFKICVSSIPIIRASEEERNGRVVISFPSLAKDTTFIE